VVDAVSAQEHFDPPLAQHYRTTVKSYRYHELVFLVPPWAELFKQDDQRQHSFADASAEYQRLIYSYTSFGYKTKVLPKISV